MATQNFKYNANFLETVSVPAPTLEEHAVNLQVLLENLAAKANDNAVVKLTGNQTISDSKTFNSSPTVPTATNNGHAVNLGQVIPYLGKFTTANEPTAVEGSIYYNTTVRLFKMGVPASGVVVWQDIMPFFNTFGINNTTVGLSKSQLNTQYPVTPVGYRVICAQITMGGAIYTRATAGASGTWLMSSATPVI